MPKDLQVTVTYRDAEGHWRPQTVVAESAILPGELAYYGARRLQDALRRGWHCGGGFGAPPRVLKQMAAHSDLRRHARGLRGGG